MQKHHEAATAPRCFDTFTYNKFLARVASNELLVSQGAVSRGLQLELARKRMLQRDELDSNSGLASELGMAGHLKSGNSCQGPPELFSGASQ